MINQHWHRAIILVDMNAFFASVEELDFPELHAKPIAVTNGQKGSCIITCSYAARQFGIKTGMRLYEARTLCPNLIQRPSRPKRYVEISKKIMRALYTITPDLEIFSIDEAFLDITHCQKLHGPPPTIGHMVQQKIKIAANLPCSIGISGDKTTAKFAAEQQKPNGFTIILPHEAKERLKNVPVTELCGIGTGIGNFLASYGVYTCGDMAKMPIGILARRFGNLGRRFWYMCQGQDPELVNPNSAAPKSMGHGKVLPPNTNDKKLISHYFRHLAERLAARLRRHNMVAQTFFIGLKLKHKTWLETKTKLIMADNDGKILYQLCHDLLTKKWHGEIIVQLQLTALDPMPADNHQLDLFANHNQKRTNLNITMDLINQKYGEFSLTPATLLERSEMPSVIAPAWRPNGVRQTI